MAGRKGVPLSEKHKEKISTAHLGKRRTQETVDKIRSWWSLEKRLEQSHRKHPDIKNHRSCALILLKHHEDLKDDPERLRTGFIAKLSGCACAVRYDR